MVQESPSGRTALPTAEDIESWQRTCAQLKEQIGALQAQHDAFAAMIAGAQALLPFTAAATEAPKPPKPIVARTKKRRRGAGSAGTWTATMERIVKERGRIAYDDLKAEIAKTPLASKLAKTEKSFYGAIGKLADAKVVVRHNGWLYTLDAHARHMKEVAEGRATDDPAPKKTPTPSPFGEAIKAFLDEMTSGATSAEVIDELRKNPEFAETIERNKSHPYNVLSRLVEQGELLKGGGKYFRSPSRSGASN